MEAAGATEWVEERLSHRETLMYRGSVGATMHEHQADQREGPSDPVRATLA